MIPNAEDIDWPGISIFTKSQQKETFVPDGIVMDKNDGLWKHQGRIWIPSSDADLQLKILVGSHCGSIGHRGIESTTSIIKKSFWWPDLDISVTKLMKGARSGGLIPTPLGSAIHGSRPKKVLHMDFLFMGSGSNDQRYILVLLYDLSSFVWLWPATEATRDVAVEAESQWIGCFGTPEWLVSD